MGRARDTSAGHATHMRKIGAMINKIPKSYTSFSERNGMAGVGEINLEFILQNSQTPACPSYSILECGIPSDDFNLIIDGGLPASTYICTIDFGTP